MGEDGRLEAESSLLDKMSTEHGRDRRDVVRDQTQELLQARQVLYL